MTVLGIMLRPIIIADFKSFDENNWSTAYQPVQALSLIIYKS